MKEFWHNFFYGFGLAAIVILCAVIVVFGIARSKRQMEKNEYQKTGAVVTPAFL